MKLEIEQPHFETLLANFPLLEPLKDQLRFGTRVEVPFAALPREAVAALEDIYRQAGPAMQTRLAQISTLKTALSGEGERFTRHDLERVLPAIARHLTTDPIRGWLFTASVTDRPLPHVVSRLDYTPAANDETGRIFIELKANAKGTITSGTFRILESDIDGRTIAEIFAAKGYVKETPALIAAYDDTETRYFEWRSQYGRQFLGRGIGYFAEDPNASHRDTDWSRKDAIVLAAGEGPARLVNDESVLSSRSLTLDAQGDILGAYLRKAAKSNLYAAEDEVEESKALITEGLFRRVPIHPYILMFHLDLHHYLWVHADDMSPYVYSPNLKDKLILPEEQTDLIDILTAEMDVLMDDIVAGKSGGTTVLCAGPPGVGKTLTAEVYSEIIGRPLYRVHSGQLGLNVAQMETALKNALTRAQRWGAVMLIDEADVYIKRRDNDITMNAVVGVFLRVLEYFNGLLFLTTNRIDDIDEAIVSRCIALIKFNLPDDDAKRRIWAVMSSQFALAIAEEEINHLIDLFPFASGRDIKGLSKLAAKYCQHKKVAPTLEVFKRCAIFRGLDVAEAK